MKADCTVEAILRFEVIRLIDDTTIDQVIIMQLGIIPTPVWICHDSERLVAPHGIDALNFLGEMRET